MNELQWLWTITIALTGLIFFVLIMQFPSRTMKRRVNPLFPVYLKESSKPKVAIDFIEPRGNRKHLFHLRNGEKREYYEWEFKKTEDPTHRIRETLYEPINKLEIAALQQGVASMTGTSPQVNMGNQQVIGDAAAYKTEKMIDESDRLKQRVFNEADQLLASIYQRKSRGTDA